MVVEAAPAEPVSCQPALWAVSTHARQHLGEHIRTGFLKLPRQGKNPFLDPILMLRNVTALALAFVSGACIEKDSPTAFSPDIAVQESSIGNAVGDVPLKMNYRDDAADAIGSDGLTSAIDPAWDYVHEECGVSARFNLGDALLGPSLDYKRSFSCQKRSITIRYSGFIAGSGTKVSATSSASSHMNVDQVESVTSPTGDLRAAAFNPNAQVVKDSGSPLTGPRPLAATRSWLPVWITIPGGWRHRRRTRRPGSGAMLARA
jgi:hypothetical protein